MKLLLNLSTAAVVFGCMPTAQAALLDATFSGTVSAQTGSNLAVGASVGGEFVYDTASGDFRSFQVAGQSVAPGFASTAALSPDLYTALYRAQVSPVGQGGTLNSTLALDLEALNTPWASSDAVALLTDATQLAGNVDPASSFFSFYTANADGSNIRSVTASLDRLQVTAAVPEPSSAVLLLIGGGALAMVWGARRRSSRPGR